MDKEKLAEKDEKTAEAEKAPEEKQTLPGGEAAGERQRMEERHDVDSEAEDAEPSGADSLSPEEREALRERRREERRLRKEHQRQRRVTDERMIGDLRRQNEELAMRLAAVERRGVSTDFARLEAGINEARVVAQRAEEEMKAALAAQDAEAHTRAQKAWYAAQRRTEDLSGVRERIVRAHRQEEGRRTAEPPVDRAVVRNAEAWAARNTWYDPELTDSDSRVARTVDEALHDEGWDPRTKEYWEEFDDRLAKYLPHRVKRGTFGRDEQRDRGEQGGSPTGGSARNGGTAGKGFALSPERVQAIKDAGMWDDEKSRSRMIQRFKDFDAAQRQSAGGR